MDELLKRTNAADFLELTLHCTKFKAQCEARGDEPSLYMTEEYIGSLGDKRFKEILDLSMKFYEFMGGLTTFIECSVSRNCFVNYSYQTWCIKGIKGIEFLTQNPRESKGFFSSLFGS